MHCKKVLKANEIGIHFKRFRVNVKKDMGKQERVVTRRRGSTKDSERIGKSTTDSLGE
jgi:hypothetical protein